MVATKQLLATGKFEEVGILGRQLFSEGNMTGAYIARMGFAAVLIGVYALSKEYPNSLSFSVDRAMRISNVLVWGVLAVNMAQLVIK